MKNRRRAKPTEDEEYIERWELYVQKWKRRTIGLGIALILSITSVIPFLDGHLLHRYFQQGRYLIYLACALLSPFVGSAALTYNFWSYRRNLRAKGRSIRASQENVSLLGAMPTKGVDRLYP